MANGKPGRPRSRLYGGHWDHIRLFYGVRDLPGYLALKCLLNEYERARRKWHAARKEGR